MNPIQVSIFMFIYWKIGNALNHSYTNKDQCYERCNLKHLGVCGSDNKNYFNECVLNRAICNDKSGTLRKINDGVCKNVPGRLRGIVYEPVCGSNGKSYSNPVYLNLEICLNRKHIQIVSKGVCGCKTNCELETPKCNLGCPIVHNPVCGDDGETYNNQCALDKQNIILGGKNTIKKVHNGACQVVTTRVIGMPAFTPICGTDGNTYTNDVYLTIAKCVNPFLRKKHNGKCQ